MTNLFNKEKPIVEESVFLRILWFLLSLLCITMISEIDHSFSTIALGNFKLPLIVVYLWMCISGCFLTYHYRHAPPKWLTGVGLCGILTVIWWFVEEVRHQWMVSGEVDLLLPLVHLVAGLFVSHSFELRTRGDYNFSVLLSLLVVFMVSTLGKGLVFGVGMLVYLALAGIMLLLDCESRTFGNVCERHIEGLDLHLFAGDNRSEKTANLLFPIGCMTAMTIALFVALPRAEALADQFTAQIFSLFRPEQDSDDILRRINVKNPLKPSSKQGTPGKPADGGAGRSPGQETSSTAGGPGKAGSGRDAASPEAGSSNAKAAAAGGKDAGGAKSQAPNAQPGAGGGQKKGQAPSNQQEQAKDANAQQQPPGSNKPAGTPPEQQQQSPEPKEHGNEQLDMDTPIPMSEQVAFTVQCNRTTYYKQAAFDLFDGKIWSNSHPEVKVKLIHKSEDAFLVPILPSETLPGDVPSIALKQNFRCNSELGHKIPFAGYPEELQFPAHELTMDSCGTIRTDWSIIPGLNYTVNSRLPLFNTAKLKTQPALDEKLQRDVGEGLSNFLQLPKNHSAEVTRLAQNVSGKGNWFVQAEHICDYLREHCSSAGAPMGRKGNLVNHFLLQSKSGNCKEFAGAMVVMCRSIGIPARLVVGYASGDFDPATGMRQVKVKHGHTWCEVFIPRAGWVPFDATPEGTMPARSSEQEKYINSLTENLNKAAQQPETQQVPQNSSAPVLPTLQALLLMGLKSIPGFLVLTMVVTTLIASLRTIKFVQKQRKQHPATKLYNRFLTDLRLLGIAAKPADTPQDIRRQVEALPVASESADELKSAIDKLLASYNRVYFGEKDELSQFDSLYRDFSFRLKNTVKTK